MRGHSIGHSDYSEFGNRYFATITSPPKTEAVVVVRAAIRTESDRWTRLNPAIRSSATAIATHKQESMKNAGA